MMPSVIPARLQFQCGHAALVTLPRVKGETATQRNDRVAREKSEALARQCDFCTPANGNHVAVVAEVVETQPVADMAAMADLAVLVAADPIVAEVSDVDVEPVIAEVVADDDATDDALEVVAAIIEEIEEMADEPVEVVVIEEVVEEPIVVAVVETKEEQEEEEGAAPSVVRPARPPASRKARAPRAAKPALAAAVERGRQFLVEYQVERVLRADDIHDALRKVAAFGAADVVAITRED